MKKIIRIIFAVVLVFAVAPSASAQSEQSRSVSGFNSIGLAEPFNVHVKIDGTESLKISASANVINQIETVVKDGHLEIKFKDNSENESTNSDREINIYITAKSLSALSNSGSGYIKVDGVLSSDKVNISLSGSGDISASVKSGELYVSVAGSGNVKLNGSANELKVQMTSSGNMDGKRFSTGSASVALAGSGSAYFSADKNIKASVAGSGCVIYSGNATVDSQTLGSGTVSKAG